MWNILRIVYPIFLITIGVLGFIEIMTIPGTLAAGICAGSVAGIGLATLRIELRDK